MDKTQQRIKIAEACGYRFIRKGVWGHKGSKIHTVENLPDYLNDLNAIHEAEKVLRHPIYGTDTDSIVGNRMHEYAEFLNYAIDATADQRAEAFLRTLGLWENDV